MALTERQFPVMKTNFVFFRHLSSQEDKELQQLEDEMKTARNCLLQLLPRDPVDVIKHEIKPSIPVVEERGESKLKLEFNVKPFKPDELEVKLLGNKILQACVLYLLLFQMYWPFWTIIVLDFLMNNVN